MDGCYCRASHTGDACRGRGRERERGISSELADMTCCELHLRCRRCCCCFWSSFSFSFLFVLSLSLSLLSSLSSLSSLALLSSSWSSSASSSSLLLLLLLYLLLLGPVVVVVVIFVVGTFLQTPQNRQIDGFCKPQKASNRRCFRDFSHSRNKKHRKYRCFWLRANAKPRYLRGFEPLRAKISVFTVFCGPGLAKTLVFTQFPACCQKLFLDAKGTKTL